MPAAPTRALFPALPLALADIKLAHSVFALPFALLAAFLATPLFSSPLSPLSSPFSPSTIFSLQLVLVILCMVLARAFAMLFNRLADRRFDAANPRTRTRPLASGRLPLRSAIAITTLCALGFIGATALFYPLSANPWPVFLSIPVLAWIAFYSLTKRFTSLCHLFLGGALAASPIAAAIAIDPASLARTPAFWCLSAMVVMWVAGFDIIYALADIDFDRASGLHSIPARLGWKRALWVSRALHAAAFVALAAGFVLEPRFGPLFAGALVAVAALLITEHLILLRRGQAGLEMAFFTFNGIVSLLLGIAGIADIVF